VPTKGLVVGGRSTGCLLAAGQFATAPVISYAEVFHLPQTFLGFLFRFIWIAEILLSVLGENFVAACYFSDHGPSHYFVQDSHRILLNRGRMQEQAPYGIYRKKISLALSTAFQAIFVIG
jgi:hypothetical protein